ncbi:MAG: TM0106 family RecB-like putative nuclease [Candidatus Limnocylindrales bacterium]
MERHRAGGRTIHEIANRDPRSPAELRAAEEETLDAMRRGVEVIYQATFFDGRWRGHADFLLRTERPSDLGAWSYDVADTKLARGVKAGAILQVCVYADRLAVLQGVAPDRLVIVTGDNVEHVERLGDYAAFYRTVKARFEERIFGSAEARPTYPDPVEHCRVCTWFPTCMDRRRADDHLSIVAGMSRTYTERLVSDGLPTRRALALLPADRPVEGMSPRPLDRLRNQARLQVTGEGLEPPIYELIEPDPDAPDHGLAALPEPSPLDLFFDIEADPWMYDDGLEYLLGVSWREPAGSHAYRPIWGHDRTAEKLAFETFIDVVIERLDRDPAMHVYHYAGYESGAIKRLMQRHATREEEVDRILRGEVLVDLYQVVRQGVRASVESYSIKRIEKLYLPAREGPITEAGFSVVEYERWLRDHDERHLRDLADYNRDDCVSTLLLRDWLEDRRREGILQHGWDLPRPPAPEAAVSESLTAWQEATRARAAALRLDIPDDDADRSPEQAGRWLLAALLDWHRRDAKPAWWEFFRLRRLALEDLFDESAAITGLEYAGVVGEEQKSYIHRYRFDPRQDTRIHVGDTWEDPATGKSAGSVAGFDPVEGTLDLRRARSSSVAHPLALIEPGPRAPGPMPEALADVADQVVAGGLTGPGPYRAVRELLAGLPPRIGTDTPGRALRATDEDALQAAVRCALALDESVLAVQGPPGTGKTWTGARMAVALIRAGRRVGVTAQSHKAITNFLEAMDEAPHGGRGIRILQRCETGDDASHLDGVDLAAGSGDVGPALTAGRYDVAAGTAWLFARPDMRDAVDVLFVDEAGQLSLANVVAMGGAARSIVLVGDPNQLPQVSSGIHPDGAGVSALEHIVGDAETIAADRGLFLDITFRMHPRVNGFISDTFYAGRLRTDRTTARQRLVDDDGEDELGLRFVPIEHADDGVRSPAEAEAVAAAIEELVGRSWTDVHGATRALELEDIIVVAPYNAQVGELQQAIRRRFGTGGRVGTVDKFQGQEGAVAVYSMASSSPDDAPRGIDFLYDGNRFNVAVSRARGLSILVCSPELLRVRCRTREQMRLANALCAYVERTGGSQRPPVIGSGGAP